MESISGRKFKTLMESFRAGVAAILEADDGFGVIGNDLRDNHHVFAGMMQTSKRIKNRVQNLINIEERLGKVSTSLTGKDYSDEIGAAIDAINDEIIAVNSKAENDPVDDATKTEINSEIKKINDVVRKSNEDFAKLGKTAKKTNLYIDVGEIDNVDNVATFGELKKRLLDVKSAFNDVESKYDSARKEALERFKDIVTSKKKTEGSVEIDAEYKRDVELLINRMKDIDEYKRVFDNLKKNNEIIVSKSPVEGKLTINPDVAEIMSAELERMSKPFMTFRIKDDDFAAATLLFYSIAAKKGDFQIKNQTIKGAKNIEPGSPRENIVLALYVLLGKTAFRMRNWIIARAPGIDWQTFETNFKVELIGRSMKDVGSSNLNVYDLPSKLPSNSLFIKAVPGGRIESENDDENEERPEVAQEKDAVETRPNKDDFTGGMTEKQLKEKYGGWIEKNGEYYVPANKEHYDGTGNLVDDMDIISMYTDEGYLTAERRNEFGKGTGTLETCYNASDFVPESFIEAAEGIYDNSIDLAKLLLKREKSAGSDGAAVDISTSDVIEDRGSTALCIFYSSLTNYDSNDSPDAPRLLESFKMPLYDSAAKTIYNIVSELQAKARKKAPVGTGNVNVPFDDLGGSSGKKSDYSGSKSERDPSDVATERQMKGGEYDAEKTFEAPGKDIPITIGDGGIQKLPQNYRYLLDDIYEHCISNPDIIDPVADFFDTTYTSEQIRKKKIEMYQDILTKAGLPAVMNDYDGNRVYNSRKDDLYEVYSFFDNVLLLTNEEVDTLEKFINGEVSTGTDQYVDDTLESAIKKINRVLNSSNKDTNVNAYNKIMSGVKEGFDLKDIVDRYEKMKESSGSDMTVNGVGIGTKNEKYTVHEIETVASKDVTGIIRPLMRKLNTVENGVAIPINPPKNAFGIGSKNSFKNDVIVFGKANILELNADIENGKMATLDGSVALKDKRSEGEIEGFPPVQNYRDTYNDAVKNTMTYASIVAQIYSLLVYLSEQYVHPMFKNEKITKHLSNKLSDELQTYLTRRVCEELTSDADVSGNIVEETSGIRKFLDRVLGKDRVQGEPSGMEDLREAYDKLVLMLSTPDEEANWSAHGDLEKFAVRGDKQSPSEKEFHGFKESIMSMVERIQSMVPELAEITKSRKPDSISYGDLVYLMLYGGLGLSAHEKNTRSGGSYYDAFLDLVENYGDLKKASERISMEVCGENNKRVADMAAALLLLMLNVANDLSLKHYRVIEKYENDMNSIDEKIKETEKEMDKSESSENRNSSMSELMEKYDELFAARRAARNNMIGKLKNTVIGLASDIVKNDFSTVVNGIIGRVSVDADTRTMDVNSMKDLGELLLATVSGDPRKKFGELVNIISSLNFSKSNKYIDVLKRKSGVDKAVVDIVSGKKAFTEDNELQQYYEEYKLALDRSEDKKNVKPGDIIDELEVITNDQIKDALVGKGGLFTDEYTSPGIKKDPMDRAEAACRAIMFYLIKKADILDKDVYGNEISISDFDNIMKSILNDGEKKSRLARELDSVYMSDEIGSIKTFVDSINSSFGIDKYHKYATAVLTSLVNDPIISVQGEPEDSQSLPEEYAKVTILKIMNLTYVDELHTDPQDINGVDYNVVLNSVMRYKKHIIDAVRRISVDDDTEKAITTIATNFIPAIGEDNPLRRGLYHMCVNLLQILLNKVIRRKSDDIKDQIFDCVREVYGEDLDDGNIMRESGILDSSGKLSDGAVSKMTEAMRDSATGDSVLYDRVGSIDEDIYSMNHVINLKLTVSGNGHDTGETINTWCDLLTATMSKLRKG